MAPKRKKKDTTTGKLFAEPQSEIFDESEEERVKREKNKKAECLGLTFDSDEERREYFLERLKEKLKDPEFRKTPGFPKGTDEAILRMSDPPYYTACPNPFLEEYVRTTDRDRSKDSQYHREPFAVDVSVGKTDILYKAHAYLTKVPPHAIVPTILHYTEPGDLILDGFCGSGMTGVAAQLCGTASKSYRQQLGSEWKEAGRSVPRWGARRCVQGDLSPAASFIAANYNTPFDLKGFVRTATELMEALKSDLSSWYETKHNETSKGVIRYTVWSDVFVCPDCGKDFVFLDQAFDEKSKRISQEFECAHCGSHLTKRTVTHATSAEMDAALGRVVHLQKRVPVFVDYTVSGKSHQRAIDASDLELIKAAAALPLPAEIPTDRMMHLPDDVERWGDKWRGGTAWFTHVHHLFLPRSATALAALLRGVDRNTDRRLRNQLMYFAEQAIWGMSTLARYAPTHYSQVNQYLSGVYYVAAQIVEVAPWYILDGKLRTLEKAFSRMPSVPGASAVTTGDCAHLPVPSESVDYIFTDPPFGANFAYAELNFLVESFHRVYSNQTSEAIVSPVQKKSIHEYQDLMRRCFEEYRRVLKPGRWMTVVFSNSSNAIWRAIQEAIGTAGFVIADVRTLDKRQLSFNQLAGVTVKQDLVISAYKPSLTLEDHFKLSDTDETSCWDFVSEHLNKLPVFLGSKDTVEVVAERTPQMLHDRMVAFHVQRETGVPLSSADFLLGLANRFPERDGMYFLAEQVARYDRQRARVERLQQLSLFVNDEATAIQWIRQQLQQKPQSFQDLQPNFMKELQAWAKHERTIELKIILQENFLQYDGKAPVPPQIHSYLSTNFKDCRKLNKTDRKLKARAKNRWYVPDPGKQGDLEALRSRRLLAEFEEYKTAKQKKLKEFRTEAVRAGFKAAYDDDDYDTIVKVADKLPEKVLQEDEKLLMYYDVASTRLGV